MKDSSLQGVSMVHILYAFLLELSANLIVLRLNFKSFANVLGRPEKLPDVCYSWWVLASLKIIGKIHWINKVRQPNDLLPNYAQF